MSRENECDKPNFEDQSRQDKINEKSILLTETVENNFDAPYFEKPIGDERKDRQYRLDIATGLQDVDGLKTSRFFNEETEKYINCEVSSDEFENAIYNFYKENKTSNAGEKEADIVSVRINKLISLDTFSFLPSELKNIHKFLFDGLIETAGKHKTQVLMKAEPILNGHSVRYGNPLFIEQNLDDLFKKEKQVDYSRLKENDKIEHISEFTSELWQIHPFDEGNTRTTAVFMILKLRQLGYEINDKPFKASSKYFRNALVRSCSPPKMTNEYLNRFYENLLLGKNHTLNNRDLFV
jgi:fido (protein-threonine AMPylation protein)